MEEKALLEAIRQIVREENAPIREDITEMKENLQEVREAQNYLIDWVDNLAKAVKAK